MSARITLATIFPQFVNIASPERAARVAEFLEDKLLKTGSLMTTTVFSG
ncbi:MAG: hypothetical protein LBP35_05640 [Candidatus Ancillula trichonymphae]|nr:hypothetical protein [Candidatus Ancillula trichonymphae]